MCVLFKKCVIGLVIPVYGSDDQPISFSYMQRLKSDALWLHLPDKEVLVNPWWAGYDPLSATGPKTPEEEKLFSHAPERLSNAYYNFLVNNNSSSAAIDEAREKKRSNH